MYNNKNNFNLIKWIRYTVNMISKCSSQSIKLQDQSRNKKYQHLQSPALFDIFIWWKVFSYIYCTLGMCTYHYYIPVSWKFFQHVKIIFVKMPHLLWQSWSLEHLTLGVCIIQLVKDWDRRYQCLERLQNTRACYEIIPK